MSATEPTKEDQQQEPSQQHHRDGHGGDQVDPVAGSVEVELEDASPAPPQELGVDSPPDGGHEHDQVLTPHFEADPAAAAATVENVVDASLSVLPGVFALHREEPAAAAHHHEVTPESQPLLPHDDSGDARGSQLPIHSLPHEPHEGLYEESYQGHGDHGHLEAHGLHDDGHTNATNLDGHVHGDESMEDANAPVAVHGEVSPQMEEDHEAAAAAIAAAEEAVGAVLDDVGVGRPSHDEHGEQQHYDLHVHGLDVGLDYAQIEGEEKHGQHDLQYGQQQHGSQYGQQQLGHGQHLELEESHDDMVDPDDDGLYQQTDDEVALAAAAAAAAVQAADGMSVMVDQALLETAAAAAASQVAAAAGNDDLSHLDNPENPHHHQHSHHHSTHDASHTHTDPYSHLQTHHSHHEIHDHHSHGVIIPSLPEHNSIEHSHVNATSAQEMSGETHAGVASTSPAPAPGNHARITNQNQSTHTLSAEANSLNHAVPSGSVSTTSSTDDQKDSLLAARRLKDRRRYATMSPTQRAAYNAHRRELYHRQGEEARKRRRERERTRYHSLEGEEKKKRNARRAQLERERYNKLSKEELAERNAKRRERAKMKKMMMANGGEAAAGASGDAGATAPAAAVAAGASGELAIGSEVKTEGRNKKIPRTDESQSDVTQEMNFHPKHEELTEDPTAESQDVNYVLHGEEEVPPQVDETVTVPEDIMADAVSAAAEVAERVVTAAAEAAAAAAAEALQHGDEGDDGNEMIVV